MARIIDANASMRVHDSSVGRSFRAIDHAPSAAAASAMAIVLGDAALRAEIGESGAVRPSLLLLPPAVAPRVVVMVLVLVLL